MGLGHVELDPGRQPVHLGVPGGEGRLNVVVAVGARQGGLLPHALPLPHLLEGRAKLPPRQPSLFEEGIIHRSNYLLLQSLLVTVTPLLGK